MQEQQCTAFLELHTLKGSEQMMIKGIITKDNIKKWHRGLRRVTKPKYKMSSRL